MTDYISHTQNRSSFPDKSLLMSAYVRIDVEFSNKKDMETKRYNLKEMSYLTADVIHREVEAEVLLREGSVIVEIIASGNLNALLSIDNLKDIGISIMGGNITDGLLSYATIRGALVVLIKDIKRATAALSMYARSIFRARLGDVRRVEARTGMLGNLLRFLEACDVARSSNISVENRKNAMGRAHKQLETIEKKTLNADDRDLAFRYITRELSRIPNIKKSENFNKKQSIAAQEFYDYLSECKEIIKKSTS